MISAKDCQSPNLIHVSRLGDCDEIISISTKPKCLPRPYTNLIICSFYYLPGQNGCSCRNFHERVQASLNFVTIKFPNAGIFIAGDANELSLNYLCKDQKLKELLIFLGGTSLDVICTNLENFYNIPTTLPPSVVAIIS